MISQEQLHRCIEQQLDNLSYLNEMVFNYWCNILYESDDETKVQDQWTPLTLYYLEQDVEFHDT